MREYIGVYHADGGLAGELRYVAGHLLGRTSCALCDITHSPIRRKKQWDAFVAGLDAPFRLYHRNEMPDDVAAVVALAGSPVVLSRSRDGLEVVLTAEQLDTLGGSVDAFAKAFHARVGTAGAAEVTSAGD